MNQTSGSSENKLLEARIDDMYNRCERDYVQVFSNFLDERQCAEAERLCKRKNNLLYMLWGGFEAAERKMLCIYNQYSADYIMNEFPMKCLTFSFRKNDTLSHRDFLGSFMALRLKREVIGDIIIAEGIAQTFVTETAARLISGNLEKIGRVGVKISDDLPFSLDVKHEFEVVSGTAASMRLDCIVCLAVNVSREVAAKLIKAEKVTVNHFPVMSVSHELNQGDVIAVRGSGKFILSEINGITKKGRIHINLHKYK